MAVDTRNKRMSFIGLNIPVPDVMPDPDGAFNSANDRAMFIWLYFGLPPTNVLSGARKINAAFAVFRDKRAIA